MRKFASAVVLSLVLASSALASFADHLPDSLPAALRVDLERIAETWRILDIYSQQVWPGWNNYDTIPFRIEYPNGVRLYVAESSPPDNFRLINGISLRKNKVFIDSSRLNSLPLAVKHSIYGGGVGMGRHPTMRVLTYAITPEKVQSAEEEMLALGHKEWPKELAYSTDNSISILIHELFHCFANYAPLFWTDQKQYEPDLNYAICAEIEGDLLEKAAFEPNLDSLKLCLRQFFAVRAMKRRGMAGYQKAYESGREKSEGTAEYVTYRIMALLKAGYKPGLSQNEDPLYFGFRHADYFHAVSMKGYSESLQNTLDAGSKAYGNGMLMCLILERLAPHWKKDLFSGEKMLDDLIRQALNIDESENDSLLSDIKWKYDFDRIARRHAPVIAERDSIVQHFQDPANGYFLISLDSLGVWPQIEPNGNYFQHDWSYYYPRGIKSVRAGDFALKGTQVPACFDIQSRVIRYSQSDSAIGLLSYELAYDKMGSDGLFYGARVTSHSFDLHAGKLKIVKDAKRVEFRALPGAK